MTRSTIVQNAPPGHAGSRMQPSPWAQGACRDSLYSLRQNSPEHIEKDALILTWVVMHVRQN